MLLNAEQQRGVVAPGHCLITACPGSGKTRVIVQRAEYLLKLDPRHRITALTFTKDAAGEIAQRLQTAMGQISDRLITGTFHSLAMQQINGARAKPLTVLSEHDSRIFLRRAWREEAPFSPYMEILQAIEMAKATRVPPSNPKSPAAKVLARYNALLRERDAYDFSDLVTEAVDGMLGGVIPPLRCTHMLVDEVQDVDQTQLGWVLAHVRAGIKVTCVGDDDQSVYGFRHSLGFDGMRAFASACAAEEITLGTTYRCAASIMTYANRLIVKNRDRIAKRIQTAQREPGIVERFDFADEAEEALAAGTSLVMRPSGTAAILARTNGVLRTAEVILREAAIPYYRVGGDSLWSAGVPAMIRNLLGTFAGRGAHGLILFMNALNTDRALIQAVDNATKTIQDPVQFLLDSSYWMNSLSGHEQREWLPLKKRIGAVRDAIRHNDYESAFRDVAALAVASSGTRKSEKIADAACNILLEIPGSLRDRLARLDRRERDSKDKEKDRDPRAIALMTLHGSKGLEFDRVWLMGLTHGVLPHKDSTLEEERRLCYVGMTRAKTHLVLSTSVEEGRPSQFLTEIGLGSADIALRSATARS